MAGVVLVMTLVLYPYVYLLARTAFYEQSASTVEAARSLGVSELGVFWKVVLPLARPSIAAGLALALMEVLADFGTVAIYGYSTFTVAIYRVWFGLFNRGAATELASILLCFTFGLLLLERLVRRRARFSQTEGSVRAVSPRALEGWQARMATGICSLIVGAAFVLPVAQLLVWTVSTLGSGNGRALPDLFVEYTHAGSGDGRHRCIGGDHSGVWPASEPQPEHDLLGSFREHGVCVTRLGDCRGRLIPLLFVDHTLDNVMRRTLGISSGLLLTGSMVGLVFAYGCGFSPSVVRHWRPVWRKSPRVWTWRHAHWGQAPAAC